MGRAKSSVKTERIAITASKRVVNFLDKLIATELYGRSRAEVVDNLIRRSMEEFITSEKLEKLNREL